VLAAALVAAAVLSVESGYGSDSRGQDRRNPTPPAELLVTRANETSISLDWKESNEARGPVGYRLYVDDSADPVATITETEFTVSELKCGKSYTLGIEAIDGAGNQSERVLLVTATAACPDRAPPSAPAALAQTATSETSVTVSWSASSDNTGVVSYVIYHGGLLLATITDLSHTLAGLSCGTAYTVTIAATDASGNRSTQTTMVLTTSPCRPSGGGEDDAGGSTGGNADSGGDDGLGGSSGDGSSGADRPVSAPRDLRQTEQGDSTVGLAWNGPDNAVEYVVYSEGERVGQTRETTFSLAGLACGHSYTAAVEAHDAAGKRSPQSSAVVTTSACAEPPPDPGSDGEAPTPPGALTAHGSTDRGASLAWADSSDNVGVAGYGLYADGVLVGTTGETSHFFDGLVCGTTYTLAVDAYDSAGNRSERISELVSTSACDEPGSDAKRPSTPTNLRLDHSTSDSLSVAWDPSSDNVGVERYAVFLNRVRVGVTVTTGFTFTGLACGTSYTVSVRALDASRNRSRRASAPFETAACKEPEPTPDNKPPSAPADLAMSSATQTSVALLWGAAADDVGVAGYDVYLHGSRMAATTQTTYVLDGLRCGTSYDVAVDAYDEAGNRSEQATAVVTTAACIDDQRPSLPTNLVQVNRTQTSIALTWTAATDNVGVVGYRLYVDGELVETTAQTSYTFTDLACSTSYTLGVEAYDAVGNRSGLASVLMRTSACADTAPPSTPTGLRRTAATETTISLAWDASTDNVGVAGYRVYRAGTLASTITGTTLTVPGLVCGTTYSFGVEAYDAAGNQSGRAILSAATGACPPSGGAQLRISPSGSDSSSCGLSAPCRSLQRAFSVASPGQVVEVTGGDYPGQSLSGDKGNSNDVVFEVPAGQTANFSSGNLVLEQLRHVTMRGDFNFRGSDPYRDLFFDACNDDLTLDGVRGRRFFMLEGNSNVTMRNADWGDYTSGQDSAIGTGGSWGPNRTCGGQTAPPARNIVFDNVRFHDVIYNISTSFHPDCFEINGYADGVTIRNSTFERCGNAFLMLGPTQGLLHNLTIENNTFSQIGNSSWYGVQLVNGNGPNPGTCGNWIFRNNTYRPHNPSANDPYAPIRTECRPGAGLNPTRVEGNIFQAGPKPWDCARYLAAPNNSVWQNNTFEVERPCGT
jgi:chitodextrinase